MNLLDDAKIDKFFGVYEAVSRWPSRLEINVYRRRRTMGIKKDCFAYRIGRCNIMTELICKRDSCSFYKTKEQMEQDRKTYGFIKNYKPGSENGAPLCSVKEES